MEVIDTDGVGNLCSMCLLHRVRCSLCVKKGPYMVLQASTGEQNSAWIR